MARPLRIQFSGAVYHVVNRGTARQATFLQEQDYEAFLKTLAEAHVLWGVEVFAYCLMSNHYHVCLRTPKGNLSRVMRHVDGLYTQRFNRSHGRDGSLFRGRYRAILIDADEYLAAVVRYIHLNPVEARVVKLPEEYRWSSHKLYLQPPKVPSWLKVEEVLEQLGGSRGFQEFVLSGNEEELERFYKTQRQSPVLGGEGFVERVRGRIGNVAREHPRYERAKVEIGPQEIIRTVARMYKVEEAEVLRGNRGRENEARKVAMYLVRRCCDRTLEETAQLFGVRSYGTVGWASHGVQSKVEGEREFRDRLEKIIQRIYQPKA